MKIELKKLKVSKQFSEETTAYTAEIHVNGKLAFHASNRGHGGPDMFYPAQGYTGPTIEEVTAYLGESQAPEGPFESDPSTRAPHDVGSNCDLEQYVTRQISHIEATRRLNTLARKAILQLEGDKIFKFKLEPTEKNIARLRAQNPDICIVNNAGPETIKAALKALAGVGCELDELHARQRENRMTYIDAQWLLRAEQHALKPCPDLIKHLEAIIVAGKAAHTAYQDACAAQRGAT